MKAKMATLIEVQDLILSGKILLLAGNENLLGSLPTGNWIGGTSSDISRAAGGPLWEKHIFATELPDIVVDIVIREYDDLNIHNVYTNSPQNGFNLIIIPAWSSIHQIFALNAPSFENFAVRPLVGWVAGVSDGNFGTEKPKVFNGRTGNILPDKAIVMTVELDPKWICEMGIVNIFKQGTGDTIEFLKDGFSINDVQIKGKKINFCDYLLANKVSIKDPLIANYFGTYINISYQSIDEKNKIVHLFAPVFQGVKYKQAAPIQNYTEEFQKSLPSDDRQFIFSCSCILNFLYAGLEGSDVSKFYWPITFGEIAYQMMNQTMVYISVEKVK